MEVSEAEDERNGEFSVEKLVVAPAKQQQQIEDHYKAAAEEGHDEPTG